MPSSPSFRPPLPSFRPFSSGRSVLIPMLFRSMPLWRNVMRPQPAWMKVVFLVGALTAGMVFIALTVPEGALAQGKAPGSLSREDVLDLTAPVSAVAINADESIVAAIEGGTPDAWRVSLIDRPSLGRLGRLTAGVGDNPRLRFSPVGDLLLAAGDEALELWNLPISALKPGESLSREHLLWRVVLDEAPLGDARFIAGTPGKFDVVWSAGSKIYRHTSRSGREAGETPVWTSKDEARRLSGFDVDVQGRALSLTFTGEKTVGMLEPGPEGLGGSGGTSRERLLTGHRFEVTAAFFDLQGAQVSLDAGRNLIRHPSPGQGAGSLGESLFLKALPESFRATKGRTLGPHHVLLTGAASEGGDEYRGHILTLAGGREAGVLRTDGPEGLAASPTGRYMLAVQGQAVTIHRFSDAVPPLDYVRRLREMMAFRTAQSYVRLMDDRGLSPRLKTDLLAAVGADPPGRELGQALKRLRESEQEGQSDRILRWANRVLSLSPKHPEGLAALGRLADLREAEVLRQAREAFNLGQSRITISLLSSKIPEESPRYPEAMVLIRQAEALRSVETLLMQAREKLGLGDSVAAEALVNEALRRVPKDEAALSLRDEIDDQQGAGPWGFLGAGLGVILLAGAGGVALVRLRGRSGVNGGKAGGQPSTHPKDSEHRAGRHTSGPRPPSRRQTSRSTAGPAPTHPGVAGATRKTESQRASGGNGHAASKSTQDFTGSFSGASGAAGAGSGPRHAVVEGLIQEIENRIHAVRKGDLQKRFTAVLLEWEAELGSIARNLGDPHAELGGLHRRLRAIAKAVKGLKPHAASAGVGKGETRSQSRTSAKAARDKASDFKQGWDAGAGASHETRTGNDGIGKDDTGKDIDDLDYYQLLELDIGAGEEDIKTAYHRLLKQYHPDLHTASRFDWIKSESERMSKKISEAYQVLSNHRARARYDKELRQTRRNGS